LENHIDPWSSSQIKDYRKMREEFGIPPFTFSLVDNLLARRNLIIGHRDFEPILNAINKKKKFVAMTGLMPSGQMHLGNKAVIEQMIYFQKKGASVHIAVADLESYATRGISLSTARKVAIENFLLNYIALGLEKCNFYFQSENTKVQRFAFVLSKEVNFSEMRSIYGFEDSKRMLEINSPLVQASDILSPQIYDEPMPTIVPVGADQDPHLRLTRDISSRLNRIKIKKNNKGIMLSIGGEDNPEIEIGIIKQVLESMGITEFKINKKYRTVEVQKNEENYYDISLSLAKAEREINPYSTVQPSSMIMRLETGIRGGKMSKSVPESTISLNEDPKEADKKIKRALTGGRESVEEQKKFGGNPYQCPVFELYMYHLSIEDKDLKIVEEECKGGIRLCGECKGEASNLMTDFLNNLKEKREASRHKIREFMENE
jgi:tryptophanyl-tRNA synthetase